MMLISFAAEHDAQISNIHNKRFYEIPRPPTIVQCLFENTTFTSWRGPYLGLAQVTGKQWRIYNTAVIPPGISAADYIAHGNASGIVSNNNSPEYPCGHCTNFASVIDTVAWILKIDDNDPWPGTSYTIPEGMIQAEPKITSGQPGYIAGVTDVPNTGPSSVGYTPNADHTISYSSVEEFKEEVIQARMNSGFHTRHSGNVGRAAGEAIAAQLIDFFSNNVFRKGGVCKNF